MSKYRLTTVKPLASADIVMNSITGIMPMNPMYDKSQLYKRK